ncbi:MAG: hypothetical protein KCHDKBKB_01627 [Elusimicrobia bacterium]|nr:hypothetical protein [Elusimicrobiota bacterium]
MKYKPVDWGGNLNFSKIDPNYPPKPVIERDGRSPKNSDRHRTLKELFFSVLQNNGVAPQPLEHAFLDGLAADSQGVVFKGSEAPQFFYLATQQKNSPLHLSNLDDKLKKLRTEFKKKGMTKISIFLVIGFFVEGNMRQTEFFVLPVNMKKAFSKAGSTVFSYERCDEEASRRSHIVKLRQE